MNNSETQIKKLWASSVGDNRCMVPGHTHSSKYFSGHQYSESFSTLH